ncbi:MAG: peptidoglycan DD-metalloendopeptidase family protein [Clostridia bacterium]|nr:peptidoglycan DD-metalloendopeptidase family protein [Clostridia bacterium]
MAKEVKFDFDEIVRSALKAETLEEYNSKTVVPDFDVESIREEQNDTTENEAETPAADETPVVKEEPEEECIPETEDKTEETETPVEDEIPAESTAIVPIDTEIVPVELVIPVENAVSPKEMKKLQKERLELQKKEYKNELLRVVGKKENWFLLRLELIAGFFVTNLDFLLDRFADYFGQSGMRLQNLGAKIVDIVDYILDVIVWFVGKKSVQFLRWAYAYRESLFRRRRQFIRATILAFFVGLVLIIVYSSVINYEYFYNGIKLGVVKEQKNVTYILDLVSKELTTQYGAAVEISADRDITFKPTLSIDRDIDSMDTVLNKLSCLGDINVAAYGIYADDDLLAIIDTHEHAEGILNDIKLKYVKGDLREYEHIGFVENVKVEEVQTTVDHIMNPEAALSYIMEADEKEFTYTIQLYDTPDSICNRYRMTRAEFDELNPKFEENYYIGGQVILKTMSPKITLETVRVSTFTEKLPYGTVFVDDSRYYLDTYITTQSGIEGERRVTARITEINGVEIERYDLESDVIIEAKDRIITHGTKPIPPREGTGTFITPLKSYSLGTVYGFRIHPITGQWAMHNGTDFQAPIGTYVYACDGGTVVRARWHDSFGLYVTIDHGGLLSTMYAHNSELLVSEGEKVYKGQIIAKVGVTGDVTGPHCHLEMYYNGQNIDPRTFIPY